MKYYGKAEETAQLILGAFENPNALPKAIAPIFLENNSDLPCRKWSWSNQLLVALACTSDARGIRQWNEVGRRVKAGSRAFHILAPMTIKKTDNKGESGTEEAQNKRVAIIGFKAVPVFRYEDTEGAPLDYTPENQSFIDGLPLIEVAHEWGIRVETYNGASAGAYGFFANGSETQRIGLGVRNLSTWAHEMIHAADLRAEGKLKGGQHVDQEIVAEFGGAILLQTLGYENESDLGGCFEYCKTYADKEGKALVTVCIELLNRTCNAVALILDHANQSAELVA